ncbi:aminopeptidase [Atopobium fossor]|uniref:aminopeptidase n=1 Tax=Atopobium fossor TaxID=39487 RepID=UPI000422E254
MAMTKQACASRMAELHEAIVAYAKLLVEDGAAIQHGQELVIQCPVEAYEFGRLVVEQAYAAGAGHVTMIWGDEPTARLEYLNCPVSYFETVPSWKREQLNSLAEKGASFLFIDGADPMALAGIDPAKPAAASLARNSQCKSFRDGMDFGRNVWCIGGVPVKAWATTVFPGVSEDEAMVKMWEVILSVSRSYEGDPHKNWEEHNANFNKNLELLNKYKFDQLRYSSSNGTNFTLGLTKKHIWEGGAAITTSGIHFFPNIPTEEVFTTPDRMRTNGKVFSALPLVRNGVTIRDFWFEFKEGRVVDFGAAEGADVLKSILDTDDGAKYLGECALISKFTPIRQSGVLFYNTLYDENASCHLAIGTGFPECYEGGLEMTSEELLEVGVNKSHTHVDFMIGSDDLTITGITAKGEEVPVFINGTWAWNG